ncbi:MAG: hypothetical protein ACR2OJ_15445 [Hyphomicrobiales bacterium]
MSLENGSAIEEAGTRFKLFPQPPFLDAFQEPEIIEVSSPAGSVGPGPEDDRMYTIFPVGKAEPYGIGVNPDGEGMYLPPWGGEILPPAEPDEEGHFDYLEPGTPQFESAHLFGSARFTMDVWEMYFDRKIPWHFGNDGEKLELTQLPSLDNALIGWGFLEAGGTQTDEHGFHPYSLNFDIVAHEIGHAIIYSEVGLPVRNVENGEYYGFHESAADLVALITTLHFPSVVDTILDNTSGNLYTMNKLSRFAELSQNKQIRLAANNRMLSEFAAGYDDEHDLAQPLTGAMFDILVDVFHENLVEEGLISPEVEDLSDRLEGDARYSDILQNYFDERYSQNPQAFRRALLKARDYLGSYLADAWQLLDADLLSYAGVGQALLNVDQELTGGRYARIIEGNFVVREIGSVQPGPRVPKPGKESHSASARTLRPPD